MPKRKAHRDSNGDWHNPSLTLHPVDRRLLHGEPLPTPTPKHHCPVCGEQTSGTPAGAKKVKGVTTVTAADDRCPKCVKAGWEADPLEGISR